MLCSIVFSFPIPPLTKTQGKRVAAADKRGTPANSHVEPPRHGRVHVPRVQDQRGEEGGRREEGGNDACGKKAICLCEGIKIVCLWASISLILTYTIFHNPGQGTAAQGQDVSMREGSARRKKN